MVRHQCLPALRVFSHSWLTVPRSSVRRREKNRATAATMTPTTITVAAMANELMPPVFRWEHRCGFRCVRVPEQSGNRPESLANARVFAGGRDEVSGSCDESRQQRATTRGHVVSRLPAPPALCSGKCRAARTCRTPARSHANGFDLDRGTSSRSPRAGRLLRCRAAAPIVRRPPQNARPPLFENAFLLCVRGQTILGPSRAAADRALPDRAHRHVASACLPGVPHPGGGTP